MGFVIPVPFWVDDGAQRIISDHIFVQKDKLCLAFEFWVCVCVFIPSFGFRVFGPYLLLP
jgi:hypothetical protein